MAKTPNPIMSVSEKTHDTHTAIVYIACSSVLLQLMFGNEEICSDMSLSTAEIDCKTMGYCTLLSLCAQRDYNKKTL